jgi:hypothetical protein
MIGFTYYSTSFNYLFVSQLLKFFQIPFLFTINGIFNGNFSNFQIKLAVVSFSSPYF